MDELSIKVGVRTKWCLIGLTLFFMGQGIGSAVDWDASVWGIVSVVMVIVGVVLNLIMLGSAVISDLEKKEK